MDNELRMQIKISCEANPDLYIYLNKIKSSRRRIEALQNLALKGMIYGASPQLTSTGKTILVELSEDKLNLNTNEKQSLDKKDENEFQFNKEVSFQDQVNQIPKGSFNDFLGE
jgi:hypothetical protein